MAADRPSTDFGLRLRTAREQRGIGLRQIASATKIAVGVLEALERNDISKLPGGIFGRAFVRSYAVEVGLDPEQTIREFVAAFPQDSVVAGHPPSQPGEDHEAVESERRTASTFLRLILLSVPVAGVVLYFATVGRHPAPRTDVPPPAVSAPPSVAPAVEHAASPPRTARVEKETPAPAAPVPLAPEVATPPAASLTGPTVATAADRLMVGLSVTRPCWVSATVDGQKTIDRLVQPGEQRTIEVRRELVLTAGDGSAVALTLNGASARPLGKNGEVVTARVSLANFKDYLVAR